VTTTPSITRATKAVHDVECGCEYDGDHSDEEVARWGAAARAAVSAALHDPDDPDALAKVLAAFDSIAWSNMRRETKDIYRRMADAVRAAILGEA
jgi:hypothetical protein